VHGSGSSVGRHVARPSSVNFPDKSTFRYPIGLTNVNRIVNRRETLSGTSGPGLSDPHTVHRTPVESWSTRKSVNFPGAVSNFLVISQLGHPLVQPLLVATTQTGIPPSRSHRPNCLYRMRNRPCPVQSTIARGEARNLKNPEWSTF